MRFQLFLISLLYFHVAFGASSEDENDKKVVYSGQGPESLAYDDILGINANEYDNPELTYACCEVIMQLTDASEICSFVQNRGGDKKILLNAIKRLCELNEYEFLADILNAYSYDIPQESEFARLIANIIDRGGDDLNALTTILEAVPPSSKMLQCIITSSVSLPSFAHMKFLRVRFINCSDSQILSEWHQNIEALGMELCSDKKEALSSVITELTLWINKTKRAEKRPFESVYHRAPPMTAIICRVSKLGLGYIYEKIPAERRKAISNRHTITNTSLSLPSAGTVQILENNQLIFIPAENPEYDAHIYIFSRSERNVTPYKYSRGVAAPDLPIVQGGDIIFLCKEGVISLLSEIDLRGYLMFTDDDSFLNDIYIILKALGASKKRQKGPLTLLVGFIH